MEAAVNVKTVAQALLPVFRQYGVSRAVLFGSVAKGTNTEASDLDILVDSKLKGLSFIGLLEDVKQAVNMDVDLFDVSHIKSGSLVEREIEKTGVVIYEE